MKYCSILAGLVPALSLSASILNENINAYGLLGSHFGIPGLPGSFDYIIAGGGTAGLALARRLAANVSNSVAVVEAGDFYEFSNGNLSEVPAFAGSFVGSNPILKNPLLDCSSRGAYRKWAELTGDEDYTFDNLLPYFMKSADFHPPNLPTRLANSTTKYDAAVFSPQGGPLQVSYPAWTNPVSSWIGRGLTALGLEQLPGFSGGDIIGWSYVAFTQNPQTQTRSSSEASYLREALIETTNLAVYKNTLAKRVLFDDNKKATANGGQDHIAFSPAYAVDVTTHSQLASQSFAAAQTAEYIANRTGMLTNCGGDILGFTKLPLGSISESTRASLDDFSPDWPDFEHLFLDGYFGYANDSSGAPTDGRNYVSSSTALTHPFSRGNVTIKSNDTFDNPVVSPNWLLDPRDQEMAVAAFKQGRAVFTNNATKQIVIGDEVFPGLNVSSDAQILDLIQRSAAASYHASSTCAMGMANDSMAVLDSKARVLGVQGLRVVDASSFPVLPPGHPSDALAEKIADDILTGA
ncbi:MAG: hypothetical protein Q9225_000731 [Loekoesia sp. 1 TL-2023]